MRTAVVEQCVGIGVVIEAINEPVDLLFFEVYAIWSDIFVI
jgi:hypothetical protein